MAVARVASAESFRIDTTDPWTFSYAGGTPEGIVVGVIHAATTVLVSTITYGGVALSMVVQAQDVGGEANTAQLWFLGTGVPAGTQDVVADLISATGTDIYFVVWELSGDADLEVIDSDSLADNQANPQVTLQAGGRDKISIGLIGSGLAGPASLTEVTGNTRDQDEDFGAWCGVSCYETTVDAADHTIGWTGATDDVAFVAIAVSEIGSSTFTGSAAVTQENDTSSAAGTSTPPVFTGTASLTQANDTPTASGTFVSGSFDPLNLAAVQTGANVDLTWDASF
jgi:hypothetical protein